MSRSAHADAGELDEITLRRAQGGDRRAQRRVIDHHARAVFHLLSRILEPAGHGAAVEDLAQETMLRVLGALARFDPAGPAKLSTWVLTIASRLAIQHLQRRRPTIVAAPDELAEAGASPEALASAEQLRRRVQAVVAELSPDVRAAFVLAEAHGLTPSEVAAALEIPTATARTRIHRARTKIRIALDKDDDA